MDKSLTGSTPPVRPSATEPRCGLAEGLRGRSVVLVGLMGAGKSTVGRRLATRLGLAFKDADTEIETAAAMPIADIFSIFGEPAFRDGERRVISRLLSEDGIVLATGGGAFMNADTRERICETAISVWLKADHATLMRRVRRRSHRPLLQQGDADETMRRLMAERYPVYGLADLTVTSRDTAPDRATQDVLDAISAYLDEEADDS